MLETVDVCVNVDEEGVSELALPRLIHGDVACRKLMSESRNETCAAQYRGNQLLWSSPYASVWQRVHSTAPQQPASVSWGEMS